MSTNLYRAWLKDHLEQAKLHYEEVCRLDDQEQAMGGDSAYYEQGHQMFGYIAALEKCLRELDSYLSATMEQPQLQPQPKAKEEAVPRAKLKAAVPASAKSVKGSSVGSSSGLLNEKVLTRHPEGKKGVSLSRIQYEQIRDNIISILKIKEATQTQLADEIGDRLEGKFEGSIPSCVEAVKLDLEARKVIQRIAKSKPERYRLSKA